MSKIVKKLIIFPLILVIFINTFAGSVLDSDNLNIDMANNINDGFAGRENPDYKLFINDLQSLSCESIRGNVAVVSKKMGHKNLLIGHSIVALGYNMIKNEPLDIIGLVGGMTPYVISAYYLMPSKYKKVVIWIGINDILMNNYLKKTDDVSFKEITEKIDKIHEIYSGNGAKVYFVSIAPTRVSSTTFLANRINVYMAGKYNFISVPYYPDMNDYHYKETTFKKIYDGHIKKIFEEG